MLLFKVPKQQQGYPTPALMVPKLTSATLPTGYGLSLTGFPSGAEAWHLFDQDESTSVPLVRDGTINITVPEYFVPRTVEIDFTSSMALPTLVAVYPTDNPSINYLISPTRNLYAILQHKGVHTKQLSITIDGGGGIEITNVTIIGYKLGGAS